MSKEVPNRSCGWSQLVNGSVAGEQVSLSKYYTDDGRESSEGVECKLCIIIIQSEILHGLVLYIFRFKINTLLYYTLVSVLVLGIDIARGQYYWILDIGCLAWYHSNRNFYLITFL